MDRYPVSIGKISESDKIATFGRLSGSISLFDTLSIHSFFILLRRENHAPLGEKPCTHMVSHTKPLTTREASTHIAIKHQTPKNDNHKNKNTLMFIYLNRFFIVDATDPETRNSPAVFLLGRCAGVTSSSSPAPATFFRSLALSRFLF